MDQKKNLLIVISIFVIGLCGILFYVNVRLTQMQNQFLRSLEFAQHDGKTRSHDFYKETAVKNALRKKENEFQKCYNNFLRTVTDKTEGYLEIDWTILEDGQVDRPERVSSDLNSQAFHQCMIQTISTIEFPPTPNGLPLYMTHRFNFKNNDQKPK